MWKRNDEPATVKPEAEPIRPQGETPRSPTPTQIAPAALATLPSPPAATNAPKQQAVIGPSMTIKGEIRAREELLVDGEVEGLLESQSLLTVGPNGKVLGNIKAREVAIFGSVRGNVVVAEKIAIREQGSLIGDIFNRRHQGRGNQHRRRGVFQGEHRHRAARAESNEVSAERAAGGSASRLRAASAALPRFRSLRNNGLCLRCCMICNPWFLGVSRL